MAEFKIALQGARIRVLIFPMGPNELSSAQCVVRWMSFLCFVTVEKFLHFKPMNSVRLFPMGHI